MTLADRLRQRIAHEGPISFRDFMAAALYDPQEGYYSKGAAIGERGDFITSPYISPAFASAIVRRLAEDAARLPGPIDFVELGAGEGRFLQDLIKALAKDAPGVLARLKLTAIDRSATARKALAARGLSPSARVLESAEQLEESSVSGWIFSNELYDALPVVRVVGSEAGLEEMRVTVQDDRFVWSRLPAPEVYRDYLTSFAVQLEPGQIAEISFAAAPLYRRLARALSRGRLVSFDYGHTAAVLFHPLARRNGTLAVHFGGFRRGDPLARPGEVDLTAHVNWDDLKKAGEEEGLTTVGIERQGRYLSEAGIFDFAPDEREKWRIYRLVDPEGMGEELSVLIQSKGL